MPDSAIFASSAARLQPGEVPPVDGVVPLEVGQAELRRGGRCEQPLDQRPVDQLAAQVRVAGVVQGHAARRRACSPPRRRTCRRRSRRPSSRRGSLVSCRPYANAAAVGSCSNGEPGTKPRPASPPRPSPCSGSVRTRPGTVITAAVGASPFQEPGRTVPQGLQHLGRQLRRGELDAGLGEVARATSASPISSLNSAAVLSGVVLHPGTPPSRRPGSRRLAASRSPTGVVSWLSTFLITVTVSPSARADRAVGGAQVDADVDGVTHGCPHDQSE